MEIVDSIKRNIIKKALCIGAFMILAGVIARHIAFSIGAIAGTLMSIANFIILAKKVKLMAASGGNNAAAFFLSYIFRYFFMAVVLWVCINRGLAYFLGAACGLFAIRLAIYVDSFGKKQ